MNQAKKTIEYEEEIDLMDYVKVMIKRKREILTVFLFVVVIVFVFSVLVPKVYKIDTVLEIGKIDNELIEEPLQLVEKIKGDTYGIFVREKLNISEREYPKIKVENPQDTNLVKIEIESPKPKLAKDILTEIDNLILKEHQEKFEKKKSKIQENINEIQKELTLLETQKIYSDEGIANLQIALANLKEKLNSAKMTEIVKSSTISESPIKPKLFLNLVIAGTLGVFLGVFWAFLKEWWEKNKDKI